LKLGAKREWIAPFLLALGALCFLPGRASAAESMQQRLLRTVQIGAPQDISVEQIRKIADNNDSDYTTEILARSALVVLQHDDSKLIPFTELLDDLLSHLVSDGTPFKPLTTLPNFRGKETVFTMVYALVMSGNQDRAVDILEKHSLTGSRYKRAVVLSALRNIGTPRALSVIQQYGEKGQDRNLAEATLADEDYPVLSEMYERWNLVPPAQRTHDNLRAIVQAGCDERSALAAYWLGFLAPNIDPNKEVAELQALENLARTNAGSCEMMEHVIALKALGLRSAESVSYWKNLAQRTPNVWERHQIVINAFGRWGRAFAPAALDLLKTDGAQYVQWELLNGNLETRQGREYRNYWDIWMPANVLVTMQFDDAQRRPPMEQKELDAMLDWLDAGGRPRDDVVLNHTIYHLAEFTSGDDTRRLLRIFNALPQRNQNWWILQTLQDPAALPLLRYWSTLPSAPAGADQQQTLEHVIGRLENARPGTAKTSVACCAATEECLLQQVRQSTAAVVAADTQIRSEEEAIKWLADGAAAAKFTIRYTDELKRAAVVRGGDGAEEKWQYLYDCWRRTDAAPAAAAGAPATTH
jgi:hypothetical protein